MRNMLSFFKRKEAAEEGKKRKLNKGVLGVLGATTAMAALAPAAGAAPLEFTGQSFGFSINDVISSGFSFMGLFDDYTMLIMGAVIAIAVVSIGIWLLKKIPKPGSKSA